MPKLIRAGSATKAITAQEEQLEVFKQILYELKLLRSGQILSGMSVELDESIVN